MFITNCTLKFSFLGQISQANIPTLHDLNTSQKKPIRDNHKIHTEPAILTAIQEDFPKDGSKKITGLNIYTKNTPCLNPPSQCLGTIEQFVEKQGRSRRVHIIFMSYLHLIETQSNVLLIYFEPLFLNSGCVK